MSETTYTLRDLNRKPATILKACDLYGQVRIRAGNGKTYVVQSEEALQKKSIADFRRRFAEHHERMRKLGYVPPAPKEMDRIDRIIAGEE